MLALTKNLVQTLATLKGANVRVKWSRSVKTLKAYEGQEIVKTVSAVVRSGINYENLATTKEGREEGTKPAENAGLPWGEWVAGMFPFVITHKGNFYLRLYPASGESFGGKTIETVWTLNGKEVSKASIAHMLTSADKGEEKPDCFTVKEENLIASSVLSA